MRVVGAVRIVSSGLLRMRFFGQKVNGGLEVAVMRLKRAKCNTKVPGRIGDIGA